ncbi:MAG: CPXCG motif-containing cysteine-rich protein [Myxococcota bacterium]
MNRDFHRALLAGRRDFEAARYHAAHEAWEAHWRRAQGDERLVLQALVLWAAALHHHQHGRELGAHRLLLRALERLAEARDALADFDVDALRGALVESLEATKAPFDVHARPRWLAGGPAPQDVTALELDHQTSCPYCGEPVLVSIAPEDACGAAYVEDCPVCCRPWQVQVSALDGAVRVALGRDDAQG